MSVNDATAIVTGYVCPALAVFLSCSMNAAPVASVQQALEDGSLGDLNPIPWALMTGNCVGWIAYSYMTTDPFIFFANAPGFILSIWYNSAAIKLHSGRRAVQMFYLKNQHDSTTVLIQERGDTQESGDIQQDDRSVGGLDGAGNGENGNIRRKISSTLEKNVQLGLDGNITSTNLTGTILLPSAILPIQSRHERLMMLVSIVWLCLISVTTLFSAYLSPTQQLLIIGVSANINLILFFGAPLTTIWTVLQTKSSASIHGTSVVLNTMNAIFWCIYGLALLDPFVVVPNALGLLLAYIQGALLCWFPETQLNHNEAKHFLQ